MLAATAITVAGVKPVSGPNGLCDLSGFEPTCRKRSAGLRVNHRSRQSEYPRVSARMAARHTRRESTCNRVYRRTIWLPVRLLSDSVALGCCLALLWPRLRVRRRMPRGLRSAEALVLDFRAGRRARSRGAGDRAAGGEGVVALRHCRSDRALHLETQLGFGARLRQQRGKRCLGAWRDRPSSVIAHGIYTTRQRTVAGGTAELHFRDDRAGSRQDPRYVDWPDRSTASATTPGSAIARTSPITSSQGARPSSCTAQFHRFYLGIRHHLRFSDSEDERLPHARRWLLRVGNAARWHGLRRGSGVDLSRRSVLAAARSYLARRCDEVRPRLGSDFSATLLRGGLAPLPAALAGSRAGAAPGCIGNPRRRPRCNAAWPSADRCFFVAGTREDRATASCRPSSSSTVFRSLRFAVVGFGSR